MSTSSHRLKERDPTRSSPSGSTEHLRPFLGPVAVALRGRGAWDTRSLVTDEGNRWSRRGEPTVYLAGDPGVALAECARHLDDSSGVSAAQLWTATVEVDALVDLRQVDAYQGLVKPEHPLWVLDSDSCRDLATQLRQEKVQGLIVPSVAFVDRPERFNLVLFVEQLGAPLEMVVRDPQPWGWLRAGARG